MRGRPASNRGERLTPGTPGQVSIEKESDKVHATKIRATLACYVSTRYANGGHYVPASPTASCFGRRMSKISLGRRAPPEAQCDNQFDVPLPEAPTLAPAERPGPRQQAFLPPPRQDPPMLSHGPAALPRRVCSPLLLPCALSY